MWHHYLSYFALKNRSAAHVLTHGPHQAAEAYCQRSRRVPQPGKWSSSSIVMTSNQLMARGAKGKRFRLTLVLHKPRFEPGWVCVFGRPIFSSERAHWTPACLCLIALYEDHAEMPLLLLSTPFLWHVAMKIALCERGGARACNRRGSWGGKCRPHAPYPRRPVCEPFRHVSDKMSRCDIF